MSTKKIREALVTALDGADAGEQVVIREALAEVEAIEKAAHTVDRFFEVPLSMWEDRHCVAARDLMRTIGRESGK